MDIPQPGTRVKFREDTPQYPKNKDIVYVVEQAPDGKPYSIDNTHPEDLGRIYVWLVDAEDLVRHPTAPSRRRRRTGLVTALEPAGDAAPAGQ